MLFPSFPKFFEQWNVYPLQTGGLQSARCMPKSWGLIMLGSWSTLLPHAAGNRQLLYSQLLCCQRLWSRLLYSQPFCSQLLFFQLCHPSLSPPPFWSGLSPAHSYLSKTNPKCQNEVKNMMRSPQPVWNVNETWIIFRNYLNIVM